MRWIPGLLLMGLLGTISRVSAHGDLHAQIAALSARLRDQPHSAELWHKRGELYRAHGDRKAALADYAHAERVDPALQVVHLSRGRTLLESRQPEAAERSLTRFLQLQPQHAEAHLLRARALQQLGQLEQADSDLAQAILYSAEPSPDLYLERAAQLSRRGQGERALSVLEQGIAKLGPLVTLEQAALDLELAEERFDAALARIELMLRPLARKEQMLAQKANIEERAGRLAEARATRREALAQLGALPPDRRNQHTRQLEHALRTALAAPGTR